MFLVGVVLGAVLAGALAVAWDRRRGPRRDHPDAPMPVRRVAPIGPSDLPGAGDPFAHALVWALDDIRDQHGAARVVLWEAASGGPVAERIRTGTAGAGPSAADVELLARQAAVDRRTLLAPDATAPRIVATPVGGEAPIGALTIEAPSGFPLPPEAVRRWAARHADRIGTLRELLDIRERLAATNKRVRQTQDAIVQFQAVGDDLPELARRVTAAARTMVGAEAAWLVRWAGDGGRVVPAPGEPSPVPVPLEHVSTDSLVGEACREGQPVPWPDLAGVQRRRTLLGGPGGHVEAAAAMIAPMRRGRETIGALVFLHRTVGALDADALGDAATVAALAAFPLAIAWRLDEASRRSETDPLTGLWNRRRFDAELARATEATGRTGLPTSLLLVDLDHFKRINDTHGHEAGDAVLVRIAAVLRERVRQLDLVARLGGEEFAVVLPQTGLDGALALAEELRAAIARAAVATGGSVLHVTASVGVAAYPGTVGRKDALYKGADEALYRAKSDGRNRVRS